MNTRILIKQGSIYDGQGGAPFISDLLVEDGRVKAIAQHLNVDGALEIDAEGLWVMPGFIDLHTHYDAEIERFPGLKESVRHGVTTVVMGNCSLSLVMGEVDDIIDLFARVENLPKTLLKEWIGEQLPWNTPGEYYQHLEKLPLGPNVASFLGHSNLRLKVLGKERCLTKDPVSLDDKKAMGVLLHEALEAGFLGLSIDMLPWHRWKGYKYQGASIPSQFARMDEYRYLANILRQQGRVMQATPNANQKESTLLLSLLSTGIFRRAMKLTMLAAMDFKGNRALGRLPPILCSIINRVLNGNLRFQSLACPFELYSDGYNTPIFEEIHSGSMLMNADNQEQRDQLYQDESWRAQFKKEWLSVFNRSFHRDLSEMVVIDCPDKSLINRSFTDIAHATQTDPVECFINLLSRFDQQLRWYSVVANDRPSALRQLLTKPYNQVGFSDAGAHNRNLGFQNAHLCLLRDAKNFSDGLSVAQAVARLTSDIADWLGLDAGRLQRGSIADITIIDPNALDQDLTCAQEYFDPKFHDTMRMVTQSGQVVQHLLIGGHLVLNKGSFCEDYEQKRFGRLLRSQLN